MNYENHPNKTWDGQIYDGSNHLRPKYDPILTLKRIKHECETYGHKMAVHPISSPTNCPIPSAEVPSVWICARCELTDAKHYNLFAELNPAYFKKWKGEESIYNRGEIKENVFIKGWNYFSSFFFKPRNRD